MSSILLLLNSSRASLLIAKVTRKILPRLLDSGVEIVVYDNARHSANIAELMKTANIESLPAALQPHELRSYEGVDQIKKLYVHLIKNPSGPNPGDYGINNMAEEYGEEFVSDFMKSKMQGDDEEEDEYNPDAMRARIAEFNAKREGRGAGIQGLDGAEPMQQQQETGRRPQPQPRAPQTENGIRPNQLKRGTVSKEQALRTGNDQSECVDENFDVEAWMRTQKIN